MGLRMGIDKNKRPCFLCPPLPPSPSFVPSFPRRLEWSLPSYLCLIRGKEMFFLGGGVFRCVLADMGKSFCLASMAGRSHFDSWVVHLPRWGKTFS